jgi:xanthine dehydrogenase large subunit
VPVFPQICPARLLPEPFAIWTMPIFSLMSMRALCAKTNTQSNTAFRGFGGPQGALLIEYLMDDIARHLGKDPYEVRCNNFYDPDPANERYLTHYGQPVADNVLQPLSEQLHQEANYAARREAILAFNRQSPVLKKGWR